MSPRKAEPPPRGKVQQPHRIPGQELARLQLAWGQPSERELGWLLRQSIDLNALLWPWPIGCCCVRFDGCAFQPITQGVRAFTFPVFDCGEVIDIAAWQPRSGNIASLRGQAFCLGDLDDLFNPATYFASDALRIYATPLGWLRANRAGIVIVRPELSYIYLAHCQRLWVSDTELAAKVRRWLQPPRSAVEIIVADTERVMT